MEATAQPSIHEKFDTLATSDLAEFRQFFRRLSKLYPEQAAEACLWYIASRGMDPAAQSMALWLSGNSTYISLLLDIESLPVEMASKAIAVVKAIDPEFPLKFAKATAALHAPAGILRALRLARAIGDYSILIPWIRLLGQNPDARIRSLSAKLLCQLRPNRRHIERQMLSGEGRVRADAIETLWHSDIDDKRAMLRSALADPHHRVVGNALIGLYRLGECDALDKMTELCGHKNYLFRAAMAWSMSSVDDPRAIAALQGLTCDVSSMVRKRALNSLLAHERQKGGNESLPVTP